VPTYTLGQLKDEVYSRLENNTAFYTEAAVTNALNEACCIFNANTGMLQDSFPMFSVANRAIYDVPRELILPIRIQFEQRYLEPWGLNNTGNANPNWMLQNWRQQNTPPSYWISIGNTKFGLNPADSYGGRTIVVTGVIEPEVLVDDDQLIQFPDEYSTVLVNYAAHILNLPEGGASFQQSLPLYADFMQEVSIATIYKSLKTRASKATERITN